MRKRRLILLGIAVGVTVGAITVSVNRWSEPSDGGRRLSQWVEEYITDHSRDSHDRRDLALRHIGANALPYLLQWILYETPGWKSKVYGVLNPALKRIAPSWQLTDEKKKLRADGSVFALIALGADAQPTLAELSKVARDPISSPTAALRAANALACLDPRLWKDYGSR